MAVLGDPGAPDPGIDLDKEAGRSEAPPLAAAAPGGDGHAQRAAGAQAVPQPQAAAVLVEERPVAGAPAKVFDQEAVALEKRSPRPHAVHRPAPFSIWRRMAAAEARQVELDLDESEAAGSPYPQDATSYFDGYVEDIRAELDQARWAAMPKWPKGFWKRLGHVFGELVRVWSGSEHETAVGALHRAEGQLLMVLPDANVRSEALKVESVFRDTKDIPLSDPRHDAFNALFDRIEATGPQPPVTSARRRGRHQAGHVAPPPPPEHDGAPPAGPPAAHHVEMADRVLLRELRRAQFESWEVARSRIRIFRNILSGTIPFLTIVLVVVAFVSWMDPSLISLRTGPHDADVALVECLGAFGGLLSAVASLRALRNFQRFYGLPLAQTILKLPAGAATALAGIVLLQHGLLGIPAVEWDKVIPYALAFGVAQIAVTKRIDSRASDLLGDANNKSLGTTQTTSSSATAATSDI
jgi:hypothetical protein